MDKPTKILIVIALIAAVGVAFALKQKNKASVSEPVVVAIPNSGTTTQSGAAESKAQNPENPKIAQTTFNLPRLVDLGADQCITCRMMAPILEGLKAEYKGQLEVVFIDVWKNRDEAKGYRINLIPTQIFYDTSGKEIFRHEGFFSKEDILGKWKEFGFNFSKK